MKKINIEIDGTPYLVVTKDGKTELGIKGNTTPENDSTPHDIKVPNVLIITRKNGDVLFVLRGAEKDEFSILTAQTLYDNFQYQWFEPLADNYRELLFVNDADYAKEAYKIFTWDDIAKFSLVDRPSYSFYKNMEGDWKQNPEGGAGYLLVLISDIPYWTDAVGQIPFAVDTYRSTQSITKTVQIGIEWGAGTLTGEVDYSNEYDNYFVLRGALFASKNFTYKVTSTGKSYPAVEVEEISNSVKAEMLSSPIKTSELEKYGIWKK
ncbi:Uncharacterised protein [Escherichia coli]|uniref:hypothetical protein n=1 Tax=Escherichia coli TaxID=562 RepID=UPI00191A394F|nr:hypothetical protein [Escherichia coli]EGC7113070.1 hypothetical protein [Salmonella enterica]CAD6175615.1 Uncharacterised protein [Escherichia coli]